MIKVSVKDGEVICSGDLYDIYTEYTILTKLVLKQTTELVGKDTAFEVLAKIGQIAADANTNATEAGKIYNEVGDMVDEKFKEV